MSEVLLADEAAEFFAPVSSDVIDGLVSQYRAARAAIDEVAEFVNGPVSSSVIHYFLEGNRTEDRGRMSLERSAAQLFNKDGAIGALNSAYWSKTLQLTDVLDLMPQKRRNEWHEQIRGQTCPEYTDENVRATMTTLLNMRAQFFSERVDGIFRGLSGLHVTNAPEAFGKRMIIANVLNHYGTSNHDKTGLINDLRCVVARFMGRDEPKYQATSQLIPSLKQRWGEWLELDGGALKIRLYKKGTAHMEVHPDIAWRLNQVLAYLHPTAIPASFRQKPKRKAKDVVLLKRPLPFRVVEELSVIKSAREKIPGMWPERYRTVPNTVVFGYVGAGSTDQTRDEAIQVLQALGGTPYKGMKSWWTFDYDPMPVIEHIVNTGCMPDQKAHQFYPTPEPLAKRVVDLAEIGPEHKCCEPSAGMGGLADHMPKDRTTCIEVSELHAEILKAKGHNVHCVDFLKTSGKFDRIVMNPPFDQGRWRAHLEHALDMLSQDGRLVSILPSGAKGLDLPGFDTQWIGPLSNQFPGTSVDVVILVADRQPW